MKTKRYHTYITKISADLLGPVECYLKIRDRYPLAFLLESSHYNKADNAVSYILFHPLANIKFIKDYYHIKTDIEQFTFKTGESFSPSLAINFFLEHIQVDKSNIQDNISEGIFGYFSYDAITLLEKISVNTDPDFPLAQYYFFKFMLAFDHYHHTLYLVEYAGENEKIRSPEIISYLNKYINSTHAFQLIGNEYSDYTDKEFLSCIRHVKQHIKRGDVFQLVLSRRFYQHFKGDDFQVYRKLRSINPSPYLFYFDFGNFRVMGSSPESQIRIDKVKARIYPIAGTYKRKSGESVEALSEKLLYDEKENAEHHMLVDLTRNDLSKSAKNVEIKALKNVEAYSHVIHLVSEIAADLKTNQDAFRVFMDSFPAGTLTGAPKYRAMELISELEKVPRGLYGGAVGLVGFDGNLNHAICIRSLISKNNILRYQAGCGIVHYSDDLSELQEVNNKIAALRLALKEANTQSYESICH
ncbi:MAG: anthranilate synthase component I family protein [Bacteroidia bacterium]|nr:anthranilate synthase component I family protein [Bacteroidia bacterium]